jgi:signal transduction histidine kinase
MAELMSARLRGRTVRSALAVAGGLFDQNKAQALVSALYKNRLEIAALAHLALLAAIEFKSTTGGATSLLVMSGVMLVVLALMHNGGVLSDRVFQEPVPALIQPASGMDAGVALALERQSQRLVEIADTAVRSRVQSEQRSQAWAELMARVSHDLRTPLNAVLGFTDLMKNEIMGPVGHPRYVEYLDHIQLSGRTLLKSTEDTLALTALLAAPGSTAQPEVLELQTFADEAWDYTSAEAATRNITFAASGLDVQILSERRPLRQILINLYSCALSRAADGSVIALSAVSDAGVVAVSLTVSDLSPDASFGAGCLSLNLARALIDLQDGLILEPECAQGSWTAVTVFAAADQTDLFH